MVSSRNQKRYSNAPDPPLAAAVHVTGWPIVTVDALAVSEVIVTGATPGTVTVTVLLFFHACHSSLDPAARAQTCTKKRPGAVGVQVMLGVPG